jgi:hypothetical protein
LQYLITTNLEKEPMDRPIMNTQGSYRTDEGRGPTAREIASEVLQDERQINDQAQGHEPDHGGQAPAGPPRIDVDAREVAKVERQGNGQPHAAADRDGQPPAGPPRIEPETDDRIHVGAGGKLVVPREDIGEGIDPAEELDLEESKGKKIRSPKRDEWIAVNHDAEFHTRLLIYEPKQMEKEYFYVVPELRGPISDELKGVRVFPFYSFKTKSYALWIIKVTPENSWYESLQALLSRPHEFFQQRAVKVISHKPLQKYRVKHIRMPSSVEWRPQPTDELLGEALGPEHFITSATHPLYAELVEGEELD